MNRPTDRTRFRKDAEAKFPHRVDMPVPENGFGRRLREMHAWCFANVAAGQWAEHSHQVRRKGERPIDFARCYFASGDDAGAFKQRWCGDDA